MEGLVGYYWMSYWIRSKLYIGLRLRSCRESMGFRRNPERERLIYRYWVQGHTIDEISMLTGIPRSSVGYYVRKFNKKYGRRSRVKVSFLPALGGSMNVKKNKCSLAVRVL